MSVRCVRPVLVQLQGKQQWLVRFQRRLRCELARVRHLFVLRTGLLDDKGFSPTVRWLTTPMLEKTLLSYLTTAQQQNCCVPRFLVCLSGCGDYALTTRNLNIQSTLRINQVESGRLGPVHINSVSGYADAVTCGVKGDSPGRTRKSANSVVRHTNNLEVAFEVVAMGTGVEAN